MSLFYSHGIQHRPVTCLLPSWHLPTYLPAQPSSHSPPSGLHSPPLALAGRLGFSIATLTSTPTLTLTLTLTLTVILTLTLTLTLIAGRLGLSRATNQSATPLAVTTPRHSAWHYLRIKPNQCLRISPP